MGEGWKLELECARGKVLARACEALKVVKGCEDRGINQSMKRGCRAVQSKVVAAEGEAKL